MMVPCWMFPLAIACGNTFVLKPSERTPILAARLAELFEEAGLPKGVLNIVNGAHDVVNGLLEHKTSKRFHLLALSQWQSMYTKRNRARQTRSSVSWSENHSIVLKDADLDGATKQIIGAAFGSAGERCMAAAVVAVEEEIADEFIEKLVIESNQIVIGNGIEEDVFLGPVIREGHKERTLQYIQSGVDEGACLIRDGRKDSETEGEGYFVGPTILITLQKK